MPPFIVEPLITCSSNWKFFSKTRSMWSRKAERSCSCRFPRLSFKTKRNVSQVVERLPTWGWWQDILLKQNFNNFADLSQGGFQGKGSLPGPFYIFTILWYPEDTESQASIKILSAAFLPCPVLCSDIQSCLTLCDLMDCSPPGSSVHGILQARTLELVAISFSNFHLWLHNILLHGHKTFCLFVYQMMDIWSFSTIFLMKIVTLWTFKCKF